MGYTTSFNGEFNVSPPLRPEHLAYLKQFALTRRVKRDAKIAEKLPDPLRIAAGLPIGVDGAYFIGEADRFDSQGDDPSVIDGNRPPGSPPEICVVCRKGRDAHWCQYNGEKTPCGADFSMHLDHKYELDQAFRAANELPGIEQPGLWCQWVPSSDGTEIAWDEGEKFYNYEEWMQYLLDHFLTPWGYLVAGDGRDRAGAPAGRGEEVDLGVGQRRSCCARARFERVRAVGQTRQ